MDLLHNVWVHGQFESKISVDASWLNHLSELAIKQQWVRTALCVQHFMSDTQNPKEYNMVGGRLFRRRSEQEVIATNEAEERNWALQGAEPRVRKVPGGHHGRILHAMGRFDRESAIRPADVDEYHRQIAVQGGQAPAEDELPGAGTGQQARNPDVHRMGDVVPKASGETPLDPCRRQ